MTHWYEKFSCGWSYSTRTQARDNEDDHGQCDESKLAVIQFELSYDRITVNDVSFRMHI